MTVTDVTISGWQYASHRAVYCANCSALDQATWKRIVMVMKTNCVISPTSCALWNYFFFFLLFHWLPLHWDLGNEFSVQEMKTLLLVLDSWIEHLLTTWRRSVGQITVYNDLAYNLMAYREQKNVHSHLRSMRFVNLTMFIDACVRYKEKEKRIHGVLKSEKIDINDNKYIYCHHVKI